MSHEERLDGAVAEARRVPSLRRGVHRQHERATSNDERRQRGEISGHPPLLAMPRYLLTVLLVLMAVPASTAQDRALTRDISTVAPAPFRGIECARRPVGPTTLSVRGHDVRVMSTGGFQTSASALHVASVCPGAVLEIEVDLAGATHRLAYRSRRDGTLERSYTRDLRWEPWTREAESLEARLLPYVLRRLDLLAG